MKKNIEYKKASKKIIVFIEDGDQYKKVKDNDELAMLMSKIEQQQYAVLKDANRICEIFNASRYYVDNKKIENIVNIDYTKIDLKNTIIKLNKRKKDISSINCCFNQDKKLISVDVVFGHIIATENQTDFEMQKRTMGVFTVIDAENLFENLNDAMHEAMHEIKRRKKMIYQKAENDILEGRLRYQSKLVRLFGVFQRTISNDLKSLKTEQ